MHSRYTKRTCLIRPLRGSTFTRRGRIMTYSLPCVPWNTLELFGGLLLGRPLNFSMRPFIGSTTEGRRAYINDDAPSLEHRRAKGLHALWHWCYVLLPDHNIEWTTIILHSMKWSGRARIELRSTGLKSNAIRPVPLVPTWNFSEVIFKY